MQNVAHGAQPDHEQAKLGLRLQTSIFSQRWNRGTPKQAIHEPSDDRTQVFNFDVQASSFQWMRCRKTGN
jgi:hypothetical protein